MSSLAINPLARLCEVLAIDRGWWEQGIGSGIKIRRYPAGPTARARARFYALRWLRGQGLTM